MNKSINYKNLVIRIENDENPESPREWDNLGKMACWHRRYNLGDIQPKVSIEDYQKFGMAADYHNDIENATEDEIQDILDKKFVILPLYLYDHSGITMNTTGFSCRWDSGQVGFIYVSSGQIKKEYGADNKENRAKAEKVLIAEVKTYDQFLTNDVFGYIIEDEDGNNLDSCCGFYGYDYCLEEAKSVADYVSENMGKEACLI